MAITRPIGEPAITSGRKKVRLNRSSIAPSVHGLDRSSRHTHCLSEIVSAYAKRIFARYEMAVPPRKIH